jgi:hypothetical protein
MAPIGISVVVTGIVLLVAGTVGVGVAVVVAATPVGVTVVIPGALAAPSAECAITANS